MAVRLSKYLTKLLAGSLCSVILFLTLKSLVKTSLTSKNTTRALSVEREKCQPNKNVLFLKTHKTGSSTVTNILNRYCDTYGLVMAVPNDGLFNYYWPLPFEASFMTSRSVNMLGNHARYSNSISSVLPSDAKLITILRNPSTQFESLFSYMGFASLFKLSKTSQRPINRFLENPWQYVVNLTSEKPDILVQYPYIHLLKNGQFFDLGLDAGEDFNDYDNYILKAIDKIERDFHLVLIMEYFDESLVLLTRELCWTLTDVMYFKQNQRLLTEKVSKLSPKAEITLRQWNRADFMLYNHLNKTFWRKIRQQEEDFWYDVKLLKEYNKSLQEKCLVPGEHLGKVYEGQSKDVQGFKLKTMLSPELQRKCQQMVTSEINYIKYFKEKYKKQPDDDAFGYS